VRENRRPIIGVASIDHEMEVEIFPSDRKRGWESAVMGMMLSDEQNFTSRVGEALSERIMADYRSTPRGRVMNYAALFWVALILQSRKCPFTTLRGEHDF